MECKYRLFLLSFLNIAKERKTAQLKHPTKITLTKHTERNPQIKSDESADN